MLRYSVIHFNVTVTVVSKGVAFAPAFHFPCIPSALPQFPGQDSPGFLLGRLLPLSSGAGAVRQRGHLLERSVLTQRGRGHAAAGKRGQRRTSLAMRSSASS